MKQTKIIPQPFFLEGEGSNFCSLCYDNKYLSYQTRMRQRADLYVLSITARTHEQFAIQKNWACCAHSHMHTQFPKQFNPKEVI